MSVTTTHSRATRNGRRSVKLNHGRIGEPGKCRASAEVEPPPLPLPSAPAPAQETVSSIIGASIPAVIQQPVGLTFSQTMVYSACFAVGLMVLVGSLRPALVVLHNAWHTLWGSRVRVKPFTESFYGWIYKILRPALLMVRLGGKRKEKGETRRSVFRPFPPCWGC